MPIASEPYLFKNMTSSVLAASEDILNIVMVISQSIELLFSNQISSQNLTETGINHMYPRDQRKEPES